MITVMIQARMGATRLPGKVMKNIMDKPILWHVVNRCARAKKVDQVVVVTTMNSEDDIVENFCKTNNFLYYRGSVDNVLDRYYQAAKKFNSNIIIRVTSDCPLIDPEIIDGCIGVFLEKSSDYVSNKSLAGGGLPRGIDDIDVISFAALETAWKSAKEDYEREHVVPYLWNHQNQFKFIFNLRQKENYARNYRLTLDYPEDFSVIEKIYQALYSPENIIDTKAVIDFLDAHPEIAAINKNCQQKSAPLF